MILLSLSLSLHLTKSHIHPFSILLNYSNFKCGICVIQYITRSWSYLQFYKSFFWIILFAQRHKDPFTIQQQHFSKYLNNSKSIQIQLCGLSNFIVNTILFATILLQESCDHTYPPIPSRHLYLISLPILSNLIGLVQLFK